MYLSKYLLYIYIYIYLLNLLSIEKKIFSYSNL